MSSNVGSWDILNTVKVSDLYSVVKYRSPETGLELVHAQIDGPHVHAYCVIGLNVDFSAHKCEDNYGIPHVLQHMIWHGSRRYPHSGLYHRVANKCFAVCHDISPEKDHACYKFTTAGTKGFASFLPVFIDHIFNPLLQETAFITEVYHIDGDGRDGGRCFKDMKTIENDPDELSFLSLRQLVFGPNSGYGFSHTGKSSQFRSECNLDKVRKFHDEYYHTSNCCLIVVGAIESNDVFRALAPVLQTLLRCHRVKPTWTKPWLNQPIVRVPEPFTQQIEYPWSFKDRPAVHQCAHVKIGIVGPPSNENHDQCMAMRLILEYMINGPAQIALKSLCTCNPSLNDKLEVILAAPAVTFSEAEFKQTIFTINCLNVPMDAVPNIPLLLRKVMTGEFKRNAFKMYKMRKIILNSYVEELREMENSPEDKIARGVIPDFLYNSQDNDVLFDGRINSAYTIHHFLSQNVEFWKKVIMQCFLNTHWVTVVAVPSQELHDKLQAEISDRIEWRMENGNVKYIKRWAQRLKVASKLLSRCPPLETINRFNLPPSKSIGLTRILRQDNPVWANETLCNLYVDDIKSNFVYLTIIMDTSELPPEQRKYLILFAEGIINAPYMDKFGKFFTAKELQREIRKDVINYDTSFGLEWLGNSIDKTKFSCGTFPHLLRLRLKMDITKVKEGFSWAQILLWNTKWQSDKLKEVASRLAKDVDGLKIQNAVVARSLLVESMYLINSNPRALSMIRQKLFLRQLVEDLPKSIKKVAKTLESIRNSLLRPENVTVHVAASLQRMDFHLTENPEARFAISELFRDTFNYTGFTWDYDTKRLANNWDTACMKSSDCIRRSCCEQIFPMVNGFDGYLIQVAPGITTYTDEDYPLILLAASYFTQDPNGPLHKEIIEAGLADAIDIWMNIQEGLIYFELRGCPDLTTAYTSVFKVMLNHLLETREGDGDVPNSFHWDAFLLQSAKNNIIFRMTHQEKSPQQMAFCSLLGYYKEVSLTSSRDVMSAITKATLKQTEGAARKYFCSLFLRPTPCAGCVPSENVFANVENLMQ
ncbi:unnamed protein product [Orchesella dallaii]|uniref:Nardilysin n=1 Tax=Orchesella dallaii TaxID=48710 RepID=A0ABP1QGX9_9HEXA